MNNSIRKIKKIEEISEQMEIPRKELFLKLKEQLIAGEEDKLVWNLCRTLECNIDELQKLIETVVNIDFSYNELETFEKFVKNYTNNYTTFKTDRDLQSARGKRETLVNFGNKEQIKKYYMKYCEMIIGLREYIGEDDKSERYVINQIYRGRIKGTRNLENWELVIEQREEREKREREI